MFPLLLANFNLTFHNFFRPNPTEEEEKRFLSPDLSPIQALRIYKKMPLRQQEKPSNLSHAAFLFNMIQHLSLQGRLSLYKKMPPSLQQNTTVIHSLLACYAQRNFFGSNYDGHTLYWTLEPFLHGDLKTKAKILLQPSDKNHYDDYDLLEWEEQEIAREVVFKLFRYIGHYRMGYWQAFQIFQHRLKAMVEDPPPKTYQRFLTALRVEKEDLWFVRLVQMLEDDHQSWCPQYASREKRWTFWLHNAFSAIPDVVVSLNVFKVFLLKGLCVLHTELLDLFLQTEKHLLVKKVIRESLEKWVDETRKKEDFDFLNTSERTALLANYVQTLWDRFDLDATEQDRLKNLVDMAKEQLLRDEFDSSDEDLTESEEESSVYSI